ncbi:hypothetical protein PYCC9005_005673 [Savitreella phatthalungensis]
MSSTSNLTIDRLFDVSGKVVLVTGGGSGIGLMCSQAFAANGAKVYIASRDKARLEKSASTHMEGARGELIPLELDVTDKSSILKAVEEIKNKERYLDVLVNNAGVTSTEQGPQSANVSGGSEGKPEKDDSAEVVSQKSIDKFSFDQWTDIYRTNVVSIYATTMAFLPLLEASSKRTHGWSSTVINITSISGLTKDNQGHFGYNSSKAAAIHLTKLLSADLGERKIPIRVNNLAPGVYPSEMTASESDENNKSSLEKSKFDDLPSRRPGRDEDMANGVLFLATNQYLNFVTLPIDGGYLANSGFAS